MGFFDGIEHYQEIGRKDGPPRCYCGELVATPHKECMELKKQYSQQEDPAND